ncbi:MAG TPA: LptA/OstA family protein, partial [Stellaceae bacterium]|nr:LptA/OstA family protein [Stellaceae bacterium]
AVATRGSTEVHADKLTAYYRRVKGAPPGQAGVGAKAGNLDSETQIYRIDADGHVVLKGPTQTVVGDHAVYDVDQAIVVVTGKGLKMTTPQDVVTARDSLEWYDQKQVAVARGDAVAIRTDRRIRADVLTAYMEKTPASGANGAKPPAAPAKPGAKPAQPNGEESRINRVDAQGHVVVTSPTDTGRGDYGVYNAKTGIVTLLHHVTITHGEDTIRGEYAVMDLNRNISRMMTVAKPGGPQPRVQALLVRQQPPPPAPPAHPAPGKP